MNTLTIPYARPSITQLELDMVREAQCHPDPYYFVDQFEQAWARYVGSRYAIATSSCTGALTLGYAAQGIQAGDQVILADTNWIATVAPLVHLGADLRFVDIEPDSWCIDAAAARAAVSAQTKAIVVTHLYGNLADMQALLDMQIPIIEDAAEAIGSKFHGCAAGSMGRWGAYSFHTTKTISTNEGGMLVTNDHDLYQRARQLSNHGRGWDRQRLEVSTVGYKFKMTNMQAAQGLAQLQRVDELVSRKREIMQIYRAGIDSDVRLNVTRPGCEHGAWLPTVMFDRALGRDRMLDFFHARNIDTRQFFQPLTHTGLFEAHCDNPVSRDMVDRAVNLPSFHDITDQEIHTVISAVNTLARASDRS